MGTLGLIAVHGMGSTEPDFAEGLFESVRDRLTSKQRSRLETTSVYYQDILQPNEQAYFDKVKQELDWLKLRKFLLFGICDAASLESQKDGPNSPYFLAQKRLLDAFQRMHALLKPGVPIFVVAQSLGGQVVSNYLWDASRKKKPANGVWSAPPALGPAEEKVCRGKTIHRLYTTGCNIPLFVAGRPASKIKAIPKPNQQFEWQNFYDEDDALGWPLQKLSSSYNKLVNDRNINAGFFTGFSPLSHTNYWNDRDFLNPLVRDIKKAI